MVSRRRLAIVVLLAVCVGAAPPAGAVPYEQRSTGARAFYTGMAVVANVVPGVSAIYAPRCLPGYIVCKTTFAIISVIAAGGQVFFSGWDDMEQTRAILYRGFRGDWYLTARHTSGEATPEPLPDPPPPKQTEGEWTPPPI
jgi:hypothetical protein